MLFICYYKKEGNKDTLLEKGLMKMDEKGKFGTIFNIQKFSLNDGPGIRTVVFFKGCPLRCTWCANPESQSADLQIPWDEKKAPPHFLKLKGERKSVEEIVRIVMQDEPFYQKSGGGITLSGGEALLQPDFAIALLQACKEKGLHTAMETTGFASPAVFQQVIGYLDLLLFDIKHWDEGAHKKYTGVSNLPILANMKYAIQQGKEVLPRLPVIPGVNADLEDAKGFVRRLQEADANKVQLLPFHQFGENKYRMLGRNYAFENVKALYPEDLEEYRQVFLAAGIEAFF